MAWAPDIWEWTHTANDLDVHLAQGLIVEIGLLAGGFVSYWKTRRRLTASARGQALLPNVKTRVATNCLEASHD